MKTKFGSASILPPQCIVIEAARSTVEIYVSTTKPAADAFGVQFMRSGIHRLKACADRRCVISLIFVLLTSLTNVLSAAAQGWPLDSLLGATNVVMTLYPEAGLQPLATIRASHFYKDFQKRGFFRIGLLPIPVAENVVVQIQSAECLTNAMLAIQSWSQPSAGVRCLELRNLEIELSGEKQPRLTAANARVGQSGTLELTKICLFNTTGQPTSISKATLQVDGVSVGWLRWKVDGQPQTAFLFKATSDKTP